MENKKSPLEIFLTIVAIISAIAFLVKIFGKSEDDKNEETATESRKKTYKNLTYSDFQYKDFAEILKVAIMQGATEDEDAVYNVFAKLKTMGDINKVIDYFGTQRQMFTASWLSLPQAINVYFSKSEIKKLNNIISANGLNYTFE